MLIKDTLAFRAMKAAFFLLCLCGLGLRGASALSLFPQIINAPVAVTTNREAARGLAFDGTNFLAVIQGDHLYASDNPTNQLAVQRLTEDGSTFGNRIGLQLNGDLPLVAFGSTNYLVVWFGPSATPAGLYGQRLSREGGKLGQEFLIANCPNLQELGAVVFAQEQFLIAWSVTNAASNAAQIAVQRLAPDGALVGPSLELGTAHSAGQRFPQLSVTRTNVLLVWVAQRQGSNAWDVLGRQIDPLGAASVEFTVSEAPAQAPYPVGAASDGTNHLVVWSREAGPSRVLNLGPTTFPEGPCCLLTNMLFPMLHGRILSPNATFPEIEISLARWGQVSPTVVFDNLNYLLVWDDHRYGGPVQIGEVNGEMWWNAQLWVTNHAPFFRFVRPNGSFPQAESPVLVHYGSLILDPSPELLLLAHGKTNALLLRTSRSGRMAMADDVNVSCFSSFSGQAPMLSVGATTNQAILLEVRGRHRGVATLYTSTNLIDWEPSFLSGVTFEMQHEARQVFFRSVDGIETCKSNLRRLMRAKELWALDVSADYWHTPPPSELLPYLGGSAPACPNLGYYTVNSLSTDPVCTIVNHTLP